jgi:NADPH-dependent ferric siderophore reductase
VQVRRVERLTPGMVRITVAGDALEESPIKGPCGHMRVFPPAPGKHAPVLPVQGANGPEWPAGESRPPSRAYTPRRWNAATRELDIDFVVHGEGLGGSWAARAAVGDMALVGGHSGPYHPDPAADWFLLAGDESALPAIATILEALPETARAEVFVEVRDAAEEQPLPSPARVNVTWLHRGPDLRATGQRLTEAVEAASLPAGEGRYWVACEAQAMRAIRRHLLQERGAAPKALYTRGYWQLGESNHPDHDTGEDAG